MKHLLALILVGLVVVPFVGQGPVIVQQYKVAAVAGPALVQQAVVTEADGSDNVQALFDVPVTEGNTVIACISFHVSATLNIEPTEVGGAEGVLTSAVTSEVGAKTAIYYIHNSAAEGVKYNTNIPVRASLHISEWSGLSNAAPEDTSSSSSVGSSTLAVVPATLDPTSGNNLVIGIGGYTNTTSAYSSGPTNSFTRLTTTGGAAVFQEAAYRVRSGDHSAVTSAVTLSSSLAWASCAAGFGAP